MFVRELELADLKNIVLLKKILTEGSFMIYYISKLN
jgi:hypothetical protein